MQSIAIGKRVRVGVIACPLMRWAVEHLLESSAALDLVATAPAIPSTPEAILRFGTVDVAVLEYDGLLDPAELLDFLDRRTAPTIVFGHLGDDFALDRALSYGLRGMVRKSDVPEVLLSAIEKVDQGEVWIDRSATNRLMIPMGRNVTGPSTDSASARISSLTSRERATITAMASDTSAPGKVIASRLCISEFTLRNHLTAIYSKLAVTSRVDLYAFATRHQLIALSGPAHRAAVHRR